MLLKSVSHRVIFLPLDIWELAAASSGNFVPLSSREDKLQSLNHRSRLSARQHVFVFVAPDTVVVFARVLIGRLGGLLRWVGPLLIVGGGEWEVQGGR